LKSLVVKNYPTEALLPNQSSNFCFACSFTSGVIYIATIANAAAKIAKSTVKPTTGKTSGIPSTGEIK
jgi:hypothetical protein